MPQIHFGRNSFICKEEFWRFMITIRHKDFELAMEKLSSIRILVIGDLILDEYLFGKVERISPEAPVPVVWVRSEKTTLGGAGNVVKNLRALGVRISVLGRVGKDEKGKQMQNLLQEEGVDPEDIRVLESESVPTILKTRILAGHQQVCRVDREEIVPLTWKEEIEFSHYLQEVLPSCNGVILSDYDKGLLSPRLIAQVLKEAGEMGIPTTVDPQVSHFFYYEKATCMTPNHQEAGKALGRVLLDDTSVEIACREISEKLNSPFMIITRGEKGMTVFRAADNSIHHIPTLAREVFDVTGAGDTVISVLTAFLCAGIEFVQASMIANAAAGVVVEKLGAATANAEEIYKNLAELGFLENEF